MKYSSVFSAVSLLSLPTIIYALPSKRAVSSIDVLNFALALEHLENNLYQTALSKYSEADFSKAGYPPWVRGRFVQIAEHEKTHVEFLSSALNAAGAKPTKACEYHFPYGDVRSFIEFANIIETVGTSAYTGATEYITQAGYQTAAASILATEARHDAWIGSAASKGKPWSTAFEVALSPNQVITLAAPLIKNCSPDNPRLIATPFPLLTVSHAVPGKSAKFSFKDSNDGKPQFVAFITGTGTHFIPLDKGEAKLPKELIGTVFVAVTNNGSKATDETIVAGPAILMVPYKSSSV